jgi:hypothetical protein
MKDIDELINETLSKEDEELLADYGREPGYFKQAMALFRGKLGWVMWLVGIIQLLFFIAALYAFYQVLVGTDLISTLRWGIGTVILVQLSTFLRGFMGMHFETNRALREIKRLELRLVRMESAKKVVT